MFLYRQLHQQPVVRGARLGAVTVCDVHVQETWQATVFAFSRRQLSVSSNLRGATVVKVPYYDYGARAAERTPPQDLLIRTQRRGGPSLATRRRSGSGGGRRAVVSTNQAAR